MDDEGPAFLPFSGLPDESVYDFVNNVDALRRHFKWSNQVTYCYARTMLKGSARKIVQSARGGGGGGGSGGASSEQRSKALGDEAIDPNSWANLRAALVFEFSDKFGRERAMLQLVTMRQQAGESGSEYTQRFVQAAAALADGHHHQRPLDSALAAMLFAAGLRCEKTRWELLLRRPDTIDKAVGYVAPDQLYKAAKLAAQLQPPPPPATGAVTPADAGSGLSPASEASAPPASPGEPEPKPEPGVEAEAGAEEPVSALPGSTANGASFALDDDGWVPPRLPDAQQRRLHRRNMAAHMRAAVVPAGGAEDDRAWGARQAATVPAELEGRGRGGSSGSGSGSSSSAGGRAPSPGGAGSETDDQTRSAAELNCLADQLESLTAMLRTQSDARKRRPRLCYRCRQKGHVASDCPLPPEMSVPNLQARERMGLTAGAMTLPRSATLSGIASSGSWRAAASPAAATVSYSGGGGRGGPRQQQPPQRPHAQTWGRNTASPQSTATTTTTTTK
ncbi:hypothetical protein H4R18_005916 [Coemansia javaensis]|uniref:CCHC-type domain-containing protein n=1 Tax=Coemansia javaensis TaxID=2761396 RepID=A0A9W8LEW5_9FUNG|nr:hypothetical protein H4R18_005916 [Coemansia javaensis]